MFSKSLKNILLICHIVAAIQVYAGEKQEDISFVVLGKTANYRQTAAGEHSLLNYHFFAEIFLKKDGKLHQAALITPGGAQELVFKGDESVLEVHGGRYSDEATLDEAYPDGNYIFSYRLSDNTLLNETVVIKNETATSRIPAIIDISLSQAGRNVAPGKIDPALDLKVSWSAFEHGNADPNGIVDDLIFVVTGDCHGRKVDHSGGPFSKDDFLTYASDSYMIPNSALKPGEKYQVFVEHADIDTSIYRGIPEIATYAATTFLDIHTSGEQGKGNRRCPEIMPAMDGGQTDRPQNN